MYSISPISEKRSRPEYYQVPETKKNTSPSCLKKDKKSLNNSDGNKRMVVYQKKESNKKRKRKKAEQSSRNNRNIQSRSVESVVPEVLQEVALFNYFSLLDPLYFLDKKQNDSIRLPSPSLVNNESSLDIDDFFASLEEKVITEKKAAQFFSPPVQEKMNNPPDFLKDATPEQLREFKETIELMQADVKLLENKRLDKAEFQKDSPNLSFKEDAPFVAEEKTPAKVFALKLLNDSGFADAIEKREKMNIIIKKYFVPFLMEEEFLKPFLEQQVENMTKEKRRQGIQNKVNNILVRAYKAGDFSNEKYKDKTNGWELKIMDMYNAVFSFYNQLSLLGSFIK